MLSKSSIKMTSKNLSHFLHAKNYSRNSLTQSLKSVWKTADRFLFGNIQDTAYLYGYNAETKQSIFNPHKPVKTINFWKKNYKNMPMRTVLSLSGSSAAFDVHKLHDEGDLEQCETIGGKQNPAQLAREGVQEVAGFPKRLSYAMGGRGVHKYVQFITANYGTFEQNNYKLNRTNYNPENYFSYEAQSFAEKMIPLFSSDYKIKYDGTISGIRRPLNEVIDDVNKVTLVGQSYGGAFVRQMTNVIKLHLRDLRYNEKEIATIFSSFVFIGFGPVTNALHDDKCPLTSVYFANPNDARSHKNIYHFKSLIPKEIEDGQLLKITGLNHNTTIVWSPIIPYSSFEFIRDCNGKKEKISDSDKHRLPFYLSVQRILEDGSIPDNHVPFVTLARSAMRNATERTKTTTMEELLTYNPKILKNEVDSSFDKTSLPTLWKTREFSERIIKESVELAKIEKEIEVGKRNNLL